MPESHLALTSSLLEETAPRYYQIHARCTGKVLAFLTLSIGLGFAVVLSCMGGMAGQQPTAQKPIATMALPNVQPVKPRQFLQFRTKQPAAVSPWRYMRSVAAGAGDKPCSSPRCTCGPNCKCGDNCQCAGCPGNNGGGMSDDVRMNDDLWQDLGGLGSRAGLRKSENFQMSEQGIGAQYLPSTASSNE